MTGVMLVEQEESIANLIVTFVLFPISVTWNPGTLLDVENPAAQLFLRGVYRVGLAMRLYLYRQITLCTHHFIPALRKVTTCANIGENTLNP